MSLQERRKLPRTRATPAFIAAIGSDASALDRAIAADVLLRHIFVPPARAVAGLRYAAIYRFAEKHSGGDIIDVYRCESDVYFSLTDISGKGVAAALHAGLVKYGIRAYASEKHEAQNVLRNLNVFYRENDAFEQSDSFASVFFARYCEADRELSYASAGHEGIVFLRRGGDAEILEPTGPVVGVLPDDEKLFTGRTLSVESGSMLVAVSDGITEARTGGNLFGMDRLVAACNEFHGQSVEDLACSLAREAALFAGNRVIDDMAILAVRFD